jgi:hypothetical protein
MFGEDVKPDIDIREIFESLNDGYMQSGFICEGCGLAAISKVDNELTLWRMDYVDGEGELIEVKASIDDY